MSEIQRYKMEFAPGSGGWIKQTARGELVLFTDHEAAIEKLNVEIAGKGREIARLDAALAEKQQVLADAKARIEGERIESDGMDSWENGYHTGIDAALAALTQPQTERCPEDCDGFGRLIGDSDGPCPACSGLESDGGGAATAAGVADAEHERRLETNRLLWNRVARLEEALRVIRGPEDRGPWMLIYRNAGGGYAGLQAIAETALAPEDSEPTSYARAFRERVCPVPEFPGIRNQQEREA